MTNIEYPRLCGGTFMTLVIQALQQRKKAREHYKGESDKLNDPDVLVGLIKVINSDYVDPGKMVLKTKANDYKSCKLAYGQYLPFNDKNAIDIFDDRVRNDYLSARKDMTDFVQDFIEVGTKLKKDERLVKALIDLIQQDKSIDEDVEFFITEDGKTVCKEHFCDLKAVCLPSFLLGVWYFVVTERKNNKIGEDTYNEWCPENGGGPREYAGNMGKSITTDIKVYMPEIVEKAENIEAEVVEEDAKAGSFSKDEAQAKGSGTVPPMQQINNPFTFIQNGNNNTQIGYIANQTNIKK